MRKSTVSVAIATYNRRTMVREAIDAALAQTHAPLEVCVADDASSDGTWEMLTETAADASRVRAFRHEINTGGVGNWNFAIQQTRGEYIAWCSDDDRFLPDHLETAVKYLDEHPGIGLVHSGFIDSIETSQGCTRTERPLRFERTMVLDKDSLLTYLVRYYDWPFHPSTIVMRRAVWEKVGPFDPRYSLADTDWFVRAVERFPTAMLARHGVVNRRHPGNWSNRLGSAKMQREICGIVEGAIGRLFPTEPIVRWTWTRLWRTNVRLRLLLTAWVRMRTGHGDAACTAWSEAVRGILPAPLWQLGNGWIRRRSARRVPQFESARQSVSPL